MPLGVAGVIVWSLWIYRWVLSRAYRPVSNTFRTTTSVVVPSFREDVEILRRCLATWLAQGPSELIVVPDIEDIDCIEMLNRVGDPRLRVLPFAHRGKRSALGVGIRAARGEVLVLTDSDTAWEPGLLAAVQMPFQDPRVGAVATQQKVYRRWSSMWRLVADWIIDLRYYDYVPAMGRVGGVICVSGRTGAYRRDAVMPVLENLEHEFFLGRRCVAGDDGRLTWLVLASGYRTEFQSTAQAMSMFPATFAGFVKQRIRWSRNSYRCYLTALWKGWLRDVPFVSKITVLQILLTPVTMGMALTYLLLSRMAPGWGGVVLALGWLMAGRLVRSVSHLWRHPLDIFLLPVVTLVVILISLPIKLYAFVTMNKQGWLTRNSDQIGGDGQDNASLGLTFDESRREVVLDVR
ncbi:glycosyltransferase [Kineosporia sp. NBRC 101731]|uniref:glycosyltransferase n=1 Tax=Kineosporia sp. NBRC 101731 TaxID=3032199 RepID=UPI003332EEA6